MSNKTPWPHNSKITKNTQYKYYIQTYIPVNPEYINLPISAFMMDIKKAEGLIIHAIQAVNYLQNFIDASKIILNINI